MGARRQSRLETKAEDLQPAPPRQKPKALDLGLQAIFLAKKHRLEFHEVKPMLQELNSLSPGDKLNYDKFKRIVRHMIGVDEIDSAVVQGSYLQCVKAGQFDINEFLCWYKTVMFSDIAKMKAAPDNQLSDRLCEQVASSLGIANTDVYKLKAKFNRYDIDKSGFIEYSEFASMMTELMGVRDLTDLPEKRLAHLWAEVDSDSNGSVRFSAFVAFYLKYFSAEDKTTAAQAFHDSFAPDRQRRKSLSLAG